MNKAAAAVVALACSAVCSPGYAAWSVADNGTWPESWPKEMEPLRKQSRSLTGGLVNMTYYEIPFTDREQFEAVWPHILSRKTKGAPIILLRGPHKQLGEPMKAGVRIFCAIPTSQKLKDPPGPIEHVDNVRERWLNTTYIEVIVDGEIVDLNRLALPPEETLILDKRFGDTDD